MVLFNYAIFIMLEIEPRVLYILDKSVTIGLPQTHGSVFHNVGSFES